MPEGEPMPARIRPWLERWWPLLVLGGVCFVIFWQYLLLGQTLYAGDTAFVFLPFREFVRQRLAAGRVPLWNPYVLGGVPSLAEASFQVLYPPNLLLLLTGVPRGMAWLLPLHFMVLAVGLYLVARRSLRLSRPAAVVMALVFGFGGAMQSRATISVYVQAAAWFPWTLLGYDAARRRGGPALLLPGIAVALQVLTDGIQFVYYGLVILTVYHLTVPVWEPAPGPARRRWLAFGATLVVAGGLSAAQLLPQVELAAHSNRGMHAALDFTTAFSLVPRHCVPAMLFPKIWGAFDSPPLDGYVPGEEDGYLGILALGLIAAALAAGRPRRLVWAWAALGACAVLLAFGGNNPIYPLLYRFVPGVAQFRGPARWLVVASFAGALLSGIGVQAVLAEGAAGRRAARVLAITMVVAFGVAVLLVVGASDAALAVPQHPFGLLGQVLAIGLMAALTCGFAFLPRGEAARPRWFPACAVLLVAVDLLVLSADMELHHTLNCRQVLAPTATATWLRERGGLDRFWSGYDSVPMEKWLLPRDDHYDAATFRSRSAQVSTALLPSGLACAYGVNGLTGPWGSLLPLARHAAPIYADATPKPIVQDWLRLLGVRYHVALHKPPLAALELAAVAPPGIWRDRQALPRAFFVAGGRRVAPSEALAAVTQAPLQASRQVVLETRPGEAPGPFGHDEAPLPVQVIAYDDQRVCLSMDAPSDGVVVLMDPPYPGWRATVDGRAATLRPANWVGRAIAVPAGRHRIRLVFAPTSVRAGLFITLCTLALMAGMLTCAFAGRKGRT